MSSRAARIGEEIPLKVSVSRAYVVRRQCGHHTVQGAFVGHAHVAQGLGGELAAEARP